MSWEPTIYSLLGVTFGDKPSPDMASFVMLKIGEECKVKTLEASKIIERDRYVNDLIHSCSSVQDAFKRITNIDSDLNGGGFKIKEWHCSSQQLRALVDESKSVKATPKLDPEMPSTNPEVNQKQAEIHKVNLDRESSVKTLRVSWNPNSDTLNFQIQFKRVNTYKKRSILLNISRLFDPLGLAMAVTIKARIALQEMEDEEILLA